jgi:hypothetical protein
MKKLLAALLLLAAFANAQETKDNNNDYFNTTRDFKSRIFTLEHRSPRTLLPALALLGSGFKGASLNASEELRTITVRDFPENIAAIEDAIKRLDKVQAPTPDVDVKLSVLIGAKKPLTGATPVPDELASVVKQLQSTLSYTHYGVMTATVHRTKIGSGIEGSGVAEPTLLGMVADQSRPILYSYNMRDITVPAAGDQAKVEVRNFQFSMRVPIDLGNGGIQYQNVGFETPVSLRQREKVVIGTTTMSDKALVVVVTAQVN